MKSYIDKTALMVFELYVRLDNNYLLFDHWQTSSTLNCNL